MVKNRLNRIFLFICIAISIISCVLIGTNHIPNNLLDDDKLSFSDEWSILSDDEGIINLPKKLKANRNGEIIIEKNLPESFSEDMTMFFTSKSCKISVEADGSIIYVKNNENNEKIPFEWNFIKIPASANGESIRITFQPQGHTELQIDKILLNNSYLVNRYLILKYMPYFFTDIMFFISGILIIFCAFYIRSKNAAYDYQTSLYAGLFSVLCSVFFRFGTKDFPLLLFDPVFGSIAADTMSLLLPMPLILLFKNRAKEHLKLFYDILFYAATLNYVTAIVNYFVNAIPDEISLIINTTIAVILLATIIIHHIYYYTKKRFTVSKSEILGITALLTGIFAELLYGLVIEKSINGMYIRFGLLAYIISIEFSTIKSFLINEKTVAKNAQMMQEAQTKLVLSQIRPHFLFNALGAIRVMTKKDPSKAYDLIYDFSKCLRANLSSINNSKPVEFSSELEHIKAYINIEKLRFGDKITVTYDIKAKDFMIPPLCIQPIVENAIKHGVCQKEENGNILIRSFRLNSYYIVTIEDDGIGFDSENFFERPTDNPGGLINIYNTLNNYLDTKMEINSKPEKGTTVTLKLPGRYERKFGHENDFS